MTSFRTARGLWQYESVPRPSLPPDIHDATPYINRTVRARSYATGFYCSECGAQGCREGLAAINAIRETLWNVLSDEQKATWYWYGFIEERNLGGLDGLPIELGKFPLGLFRIHVGNSVGRASAIFNGVAMTGVCCFIPERVGPEHDVLSNVLAVRTDARMFWGTGCSNPTAEESLESDYKQRNRKALKDLGYW